MQMDCLSANEIKDLKNKLDEQKSKIEAQEQQLLLLKNELEETKKESLESYDFNSTIYITIDSNFIIKSINFQATYLLGMERKQLLDQLFLNFVDANSKATLIDNVQKLSDNKFKQNCNIELLPKVGSKRSVLIESTLLKNKLIRLCLIDMTSNRQLINQINQIFELEKSLHLINNLFQRTNDAMAALDSELYIRVINLSFSELFSKIFAIKIDVGMNLNNILTDFPELKSKIINACKQALLNKITTISIENQNSNDEAYYCYEISIHYLYNQYYKKNELIFRIKNLTEYKLQERRERKRQAEIALSCRTSAMGEMAAALAHEVNQPLTAIIAYSRACLLIINNKLDNEDILPKLLDPLQKIASQAERAGEIVHSMKNFMRNGNFNKEETNINLLVQEAIAILHYELWNFELKITLNLMEGLPMIMANKIHLMQVILNLARNSIEALQSVNEKKPELIIETNQSPDFINVHVRDNGPGIPKEFRNKILNTYFTTKLQGTGIGLGICRTLIEEHGGKLRIPEHDEKGAWFMFTLPMQMNDYA